MYRISLSDAERTQLLHVAQTHTHPVICRHVLAIYLLSLGQSRHAVTTQLNIHRHTLRAYVKSYLADGLSGLMTLHYAPRVGALEAHRTQIIDELEQDPPATVKEAQHRIAALTGIQRCETQVRLFLKKTNFGGAK